MQVAEVNTKDRTQWIESLYLESFPAVAKMVSQRGGSLQQAKDLFQDALIILYEKQLENHSQIENEHAYVLGIAKHLWFKRSAETPKEVELPSDFSEWTAVESPSYSSEKILTFLSVAGQKCMDLLEAFYYRKFDMRKLANHFGFAGERSATVQKFKCLEKVRDQVKAKGLQYEDFAE